jgi:hypothetical protein
MHVDGEFLGGGGDVYPADFAQGPVLAAFHEEVRALIDLAQGAATALLTTHRALLDELVVQLLDHESLEGPTLKALIDPLRPGQTVELDPPPTPTGGQRNGSEAAKVVKA